MDKLTLIMHLSRRRFQLYEEELENYGIVATLEAGMAKSDNPNIPLKMVSSWSDEQEIEMRKKECDHIRTRIAEIETFMQAIADSELKEFDAEDLPLEE